MQQLIDGGITLDLCPTSNVQAGTVPSFAEHPLARLLRAGVPVTINTDDVIVSDLTLSQELFSCVRELGLTLPEIWGCQLHALRAAFVDEPTRARLLAEFEAWAEALPELSPAAAG
jgi:adenosine deaminase